MRKVFIDKEFDINVDTYDGDVYDESICTVMEVDTYNESVRSLRFDPKQARRISKTLATFADQHDARMTKAKARGAAIIKRHKEEDARDNS